jgi:hypothetical protein
MYFNTKTHFLQELLAAPDFNVGLPFQFLQSMTFPVPRFTSEAEDNRVTVNITSMMNADLTTIYFGVRSDVDSSPSGIITNPSGNRYNQMAYQELLDIEVTLNGQVLHRYDSTTYDAFQSAMCIGPVYAQVASWIPDDTAGGGGAGEGLASLAGIVPACIYEINFTRLRAMAIESHMMNSPRFTNQTMQISFSLRNSVANRKGWAYGVVGGVDGRYKQSSSFTLVTAYSYNAVFLVGGSGGNSKLYTQ